MAHQSYDIAKHKRSIRHYTSFVRRDAMNERCLFTLDKIMTFLRVRGITLTRNMDLTLRIMVTFWTRPDRRCEGGMAWHLARLRRS